VDTSARKRKLSPNIMLPRSKAKHHAPQHVAKAVPTVVPPRFTVSSEMTSHKPIVIPRPLPHHQPIVQPRVIPRPLQHHPPKYPPPHRLHTDNELPDWATFKFSPKAWMKILEGDGVDVTAQQELFLLAQIDHVSAAKVIGKFLKTKADGRTLDNPSAWLHRNIKYENETKGYWS
jgi:hypothetical protein